LLPIEMLLCVAVVATLLANLSVAITVGKSLQWMVSANLVLHVLVKILVAEAIVTAVEIMAVSMVVILAGQAEAVSTVNLAMDLVTAVEIMAVTTVAILAAQAEAASTVNRALIS
jgi:hypothetical protein